MNLDPPPPELQIFISNTCIEYGLSSQTHHNTIAILMNEDLPESANHDLDVVMAALFISHKIYDV